MVYKYMSCIVRMPTHAYTCIGTNGKVLYTLLKLSFDFGKFISTNQVNTLFEFDSVRFIMKFSCTCHIL